MSEKTAAEKMRLTPSMRIAVLHLPEDLESRLGVPAEAVKVADPAGADFVLTAATTQAEAETKLRALAPAISEKTLAWFVYPKGSRAAGYDLSRDIIWAFAETIGLTAVASIAVDDTWSALRVRRRAE